VQFNKEADRSLLHSPPHTKYVCLSASLKKAYGMKLGFVSHVDETYNYLKPQHQVQ